MAIPKTIRRMFDQLLQETPTESGSAFSGPLANVMAAKIACDDLLEVGDDKAKRAAGELKKTFTTMLDLYGSSKRRVEDLYTTAAERAAAGKKKAKAEKSLSKAGAKKKATKKATKKKRSKKH